MCLTTRPAATALAATLVLAATLSAGVARGAGGFNACKALQASFDPFWKSKVLTGPLATSPAVRTFGHAYICEWAGRRTAEGGFDYGVALNFSPARSAALAKQNFAHMHASPKNVKARVAGADEAYGNQESKGGVTYSTIYFRRSVYTGVLATSTPGGERGLLAAQRLLETFLRRVRG
ncbi:MAG TPA: hypothetical protein VH816_10665 [Gaiellaceae bacterium]|jgi:hypothetical protein